MAFFPENKGYSLKEFHEEYSKRLSKALNQLDPKLGADFVKKESVASDAKK